jgi:hypothetical protein
MLVLLLLKKFVIVSLNFNFPFKKFGGKMSFKFCSSLDLDPD